MFFIKSTQPANSLIIESKKLIFIHYGLYFNTDMFYKGNKKHEK